MPWPSVAHSTIFDGGARQRYGLRDLFYQGLCGLQQLPTGHELIHQAPALPWIALLYR